MYLSSVPFEVHGGGHWAGEQSFSQSPRFMLSNKKKEKKKKEPFWVFSFFKELVLFIPVSLGLGRKVAFGY